MTWTNLAIGHLTDAQLQAMTKDQLADHLRERTGAAPRGAPSKPELIRTIQRLYKWERREDARQRALDKIGV